MYLRAAQIRGRRKRGIQEEIAGAGAEDGGDDADGDPSQPKLSAGARNKLDSVTQPASAEEVAAAALQVVREAGRPIWPPGRAPDGAAPLGATPSA